jgi:sporulation protein YlmC with PRC-barrel domain
MEVSIELLLGAKVHDVEGKNVGRIEEFRVRRDEKTCVLETYLVGASAWIDRLSAWTLVRPIKRYLRTSKVVTVYEVAWQDMDVSDPKTPRLRIAKADLRHAK